MRGNINKILSIIKKINYILDRRQKNKAIWVLVTALISSNLELLSVTAILPFVQAVISPEALFDNQYIKKVAVLLSITTANELLIFVGICICVVYILKNGFLIFSQFIQYDYATKVQKELSIRMLKSYMGRPYSYFLNVNSAEIMRGCATDISSVYSILSYIMTIFSEMITIILIALFIIATDPFIAIGVLMIMGVALLGIVIGFKPIVKKAGKINIETATEKNKIIYQITSGIKEIFVMQRKKVFVDDYARVSEKSRIYQRTFETLNSAPDRIIECTCVCGIIIVVCMRMGMSDADKITFVPKLAAFAMAAFKIFPSIGKIASRINASMYYICGFENVYNIMYAAEKYNKERIGYISEQRQKKDISNAAVTFQHSLDIKHIYWKYQNQDKPVLTDANLRIEKGESIAFIGSSGAGKTTLADIVLGLLQPRKGTIEMDGIDVYTIPDEWAHIVGYVPQTVFLIDDTIRNNIAFGLPQEIIEDEAIWEALEQAQLKKFVESLPDGLDTAVGERGIKLSGGQRQRIAIARALYNNPEIMVLDEATAALDNETETAVMESIEALQGHMTMIIVAHRLTTIRNCDKIYEIKDGVAVECKKEEVLRNVA